MRVAWKEHGNGDPIWFARIGLCTIALREMRWHDSAYRENRWVYTVYHYPGLAPGGDGSIEREILDEGNFDVVRVRWDAGLREAQDRAVEIARKVTLCKRPRRQREALSPEAATWLEAKLLDIIQSRYNEWKDSNARLCAAAEAGDRSAQDAIYYQRASGRSLYPEPQLSTARLADEVAQYTMPEELEAQSDKRFYDLVRTALDRLRKAGAITTSTGVYRGREVKLWEPVS